MLTAARFRQHCVQLVDPNTTPEQRKDLVTEVRDSIELVHSQDYDAFLTNFLPAFKTVLSALTRPQQVDNIVHQTRAIILEVLNRLPHNDVMRTKFLEVYAVAMEILQQDNEENAVTAIHIIFDLHKNYRGHLGNRVQPFLDFVRSLYESFETTVKALLLSKRPEQAAQGAPRFMPKSVQSFKVMTECPLLVMFVFQLYPTFIKTNITNLLPLMLRAIEVEGSPQTVHEAPKSTFQEFVAAQVKTVSFLAYLLKQFPDLMKPEEMSIPRSIVKLLQSCPGESVAIRKELLVATRHILATPFRQGFYGQIDLLLEPKILVGTGRGATDTLRPLAYSFLAELVHCVRLNLSIPQLEKIIAIFSTNLHDATFPYTLQTSAVRLLLNLIEGILKVDEGDNNRSSAARELLLRILKTMVEKYVTLGSQVPRLLQSMEALRAKPDAVGLGKRLCDMPLGDPMKEINDFKTLLKTLTLGLKTLIWSAINIRVSQVGAPKNSSTPSNNADKTGATASGGGSGSGRSSTRAGLLERECEIVAKLLGAGQDCFRLYSQLEEANRPLSESSEPSSAKLAENENRVIESTESARDVDSRLDRHAASSRPVVATAQEEREMFDQFAQIFTVLDVRSFQDVFGLRMDDLFDHVVNNPAALMIPQHFLANSNISKYFADILLNFLVENLSVLDVALPQSATALQSTSALSREEKAAQSLLKLFKILFASVTLFPTNEPVLRLHIGSIVRTCLTYAEKARDPHNYLHMLRALFKTLTNTKSDTQFEQLYRDFVPLVEPLFRGLLNLYQGPNRLAHNELIVELCLTVPARPSTIFPYLDLQIKPIVWALEGGRENMQYGLRTLEFWVDMLQPTYLETLIVQVEPDLTNALYRLLRAPLSVTFGASTLRIIGKLGSRARRNVSMKMPFEIRAGSKLSQQVCLTWPNGSEAHLGTDALIHLSADALLNRREFGSSNASNEHKVQGWKFLYSCLSLFMGTRRFTNLTSDAPGCCPNDNTWALSEIAKSPDHAEQQILAANRKQLSQLSTELAKKLLVSLIAAPGCPEFCKFFSSHSSGVYSKQPVQEHLRLLSRYFALLAVQNAERSIRPGAPKDHLQPSEFQSGHSQLDPATYVEAITEVLSLEDQSFCEGGLSSLRAFVEGVLDYCLSRRRHSSNEREETEQKSRGVVPITTLGTTVGSNIVQAASQEKTLSAASRRSPGDLQAQKKSGTTKVESDASQAAGSEKRASGDGNMMDVDTAQDTRGSKDAQLQSGQLEDEHVLAISLNTAVEFLCHSCHQRTWNAKWAGANGLRAMVDLIPEEALTSPHLSSMNMHIIRALLFVVRDCSEDLEGEIADHGRRTLQKLLRTCFSRGGNNSGPQSLPPPISSVARETTMRLAMDLVCDSATARETARQSLRILATTLGREVSDLLTPVKEHLLRPLQQRPLRQHQFPLQIGFMEAIIFCLQLEKPVLASELFSTSLRDLVLSEVIATSEDATIEKLTEAEEGIRHKLIENKVIQVSVVKHLVQLRRKVVELLCSVAVQCSNFLQEHGNDDLFRKMISSFFKNLQSRDESIVQIAKRGLKQAISKHQKPKELLQQNLRPILGNLADHKKLSIPYLQGLSRVLELFSHWFNVNLGEKLLEHLQRWTEPEKLAQLKRWAPGTEAKVGAAILDLFHLLPPAASKFLEKIVHMVIRLESVLTVAGPGVAHLGLKSAKASSTSPYRAPLLKYCNQHAVAAARFFLMNLDNDMMRQLFFVMIRAKESQALQKELMGNPKRLVSPAFLSVDGMGAKSLHVIALIDLLSKRDVEWLASDPDLMLKLTTYWKAISSFSEVHQISSSSRGRVVEVKTIAEIFIRYCSHFRNETNILFDLLPVFATRTSCDFTFVRDVLRRSVTTDGSCSSRKAVIVKFLSLFQDKSLSQERKVHALQYIVTPMIEFHLSERKEQQDKLSSPQNENTGKQGTPSTKSAEDNRTSSGPSRTSNEDQRQGGATSAASNVRSEEMETQKEGSGAPAETEKGSNGSRGDCPKDPDQKKDASKALGPDTALDAVMVQRIMKELLDQPDEVLRNYDEPLSAELLRLATILMQYMPTELGRYRKELIKFGWNHLKREESIAKQWAFVNVSRFFEAYQAPVKIILQVYVALLRACQGDGKDLVQKALDILTPALPRRLVHNPADHKYPIWIRYTKKILLEEGHSVPNLVHIWQLITRHSPLFYVARAQFVPIMVNSLSRIGLNQSAPPESRRLALDLVDLIITWEKKRRLLHDGGTHRSDTSGSRKRSRDEESKQDTVMPDAGEGASNAQIRGRDSSDQPPAKTRKSSDSQAIPVASSPSRPAGNTTPRESEDFKPAPAMVDILVTFLLQVPFRPMDRREGPLVSKKCVVLLEEALGLWPEATAKLGFMEKLLSVPPGEKAGVAAQAAASNKSGSGNATPDNNAAEGKNNARNDSLRGDKSEQSRSKRNAVRHTALKTALSLAMVFTKIQGRRLVEGNVVAIRSLVRPSVTENNIDSATEFASLLGELLKVCPCQNAMDQSSGLPVTGNKNSVNAKQESGGDNSKAGAILKGARVSTDQVNTIYKVVQEAVQLCLKSQDAMSNQCGLVILKTLSQSARDTFVKFQEAIIRSLHRLTKESFNSGQQSSGASNPSPNATAIGTGGQKNTGSNDRVGPGATPQNSMNAAVPNAGGPDSTQTPENRTGKPQGTDDAATKSNETKAMILCISLLGDNILSLEPAQRKNFFHVLWALIDRCMQVDVLLEIVRVVGSWVLWKPKDERKSIERSGAAGGQKEPLSAKEKVHFLLKMVVFERIGGPHAGKLMRAYLNIILKIFGGEERRPELLAKLERAFMLGMKCQDSSIRQQFFHIYDASMSPALPFRLGYVLAKQEWEYLADTLWIKHAVELLLSATEKNEVLRCHESCEMFPVLVREKSELVAKDDVAGSSLNVGRRMQVAETKFVRDQELQQFCVMHCTTSVDCFLSSLRPLLHHDPETAYQAWIDLLPRVWNTLSVSDRSSMERSLPLLLTKEYHQVQATWPRNNIQALLDSIITCEPLPALRPDLVYHLGSRWNVWHTSILYLEKRDAALRSNRGKSTGSVAEEKSNIKTRAELEDIADALAGLYRQLQERDYLAGMWKARAKCRSTQQAIALEQLGEYARAQEIYTSAVRSRISGSDSGSTFSKLDRTGRAEVCFWEERWIQCSRSLCQWDALTEFSRVVVNSELLQDCLWRVPDWSALKELLIKNPVEDGPQLKLYQAYVQLQENKLELADSFIMQGYQRTLERYSALPETADLDASGPVLVQFQQLVELQESGRILGELNALSRHGSGSINVEQKIDNVRQVLNTWRERLPSLHESLSVWNDVLTWRNHVHAVVVNVLEALKEAASAKVAAAQGSSGGTGNNRNHGNGLATQNPQVQAAAAIAQALPQQVLVMGVNETAWNVHRFAKACRKQGFPDMALYALQKLYPFGTMELNEYFVKTKETARSYMSKPRGVENGTNYGLHELNRCNMDHFNARQKAQLFTVRGKLCADLGKEEDAVEAYSIALSTSSDVGSAWLAWGQYCYRMQDRLLAKNVSDESANVSALRQELGSPAAVLHAGLEWREAAANCILQAAKFGSRKARMHLSRALRLLILDVQSRLEENCGTRQVVKHENSSSDISNSPSKGVQSANQRKDAAGRTLGQPSSQDVVAVPDVKPTSQPNDTSSGQPTTLQKTKPQCLEEGVAKVLTNLSSEIPTWMWLPWLHQLVLMLGRKEGPVVRPILVRIAQQYPQALFFQVRSYMEERKTIDRPEKHLTKEAMKLGRPITQALLPAASTAQAAAVRQMQQAKENVHRVQRRYMMIQKAMQGNEAAITNSQALQDKSELLAKKSQLKEELINTHRMLERCMREYQAAQQRHRQIVENGTNSQVSGLPPQIAGAKKQVEGGSKPPGGDGQPTGGQEIASKQRISSGSSHVTENSEASARRISTPGISENSQENDSFLTKALGTSDTPFAHADYVMAHVVKSHHLLYLEMERMSLELSFRFKPQREEHLLSIMNALLQRCCQFSVKMGKEVAPSFRTALEEVSRRCFGTGTEQRDKVAEQRDLGSIADLKAPFEAELAPQTAKDFPTQIEPFITRLRRWQRIFQRRVKAMPDFIKLESLSRHTIEVNGSDLEVFGQYQDVEVMEPNLDKHVKIQRFGADVRVIRRQSSPARGINVLGSNGKSYNFVLETSVSGAAQASEERTAQVYRMLNSYIFAKNSEAYRRRIQLTAPTFVPTGARTRLVSDDPGLVSLAEGLEEYLDHSGKAFDDPLMAFRQLSSEAFLRRRSEASDSSSRAESIAARVEAYHSVCDAHVPDTCLLKWVRSRMPTPSRDFIFRKRFAETLGPASVVAYSLAIGARKPQNILFSWNNGAIHNIHMRSLVSGRGIIENDEAVPFRLTRNLVRILGPVGMGGPFYGAMAAALRALLLNGDLLKMFLDFVMRDELVAWINAKADGARQRSGAESDISRSLANAKIVDKCLGASVNAVVQRLNSTDQAQRDNVDRGVREELSIERRVDSLMETATKPENLAQMDSSWQAWY